MKLFDIKNIKGLTAAEVKERLLKFGYNELPSSKPKTVFHIALEVIKEPMFILLVVCGSLYLFLGDFQEAIMLLGFVFVIMGITFYQERKTERALEALKDLSSPRALVIRDGAEIRIAGREVVKDDMIVLREGDRIPADAYVLDSINLSIEESLLTGESVPVRKSDWDGKTEKQQPGGDDLPFVYSGTLVTQGQAYAKVFATGMETELGKIGKAIQSVKEEETNLKKETRKIVKTVLIVGVILCAVIITAYGITRGNIVEGFLAGITFAMAILPEEFPVVLTIFMALGAWRISKKNVLTRRIPAVETLGSATVLCTDKTGTLTQNKMTVDTIYARKEYLKLDKILNDGLPESFHQLVEYGILASQKDPFDPMEKAIAELGRLKLGNTEHLHQDWGLVHQYPLSRELLAMSHVWISPDGEDYFIAAKGAPEAIMELCHLPEEKRSETTEAIEKMAAKGLRVLGVAHSFFKKKNLPEVQHDIHFEFIGLIGLADPIRPSVKNAIAECYKAGIKVIMITGDYPVTAENIGKQIGLDNPEKYITGAELERLTEEELRKKIKDVNIFARVVPEQKLRIVNALKANGEIVAMTGDGVNDAPALKSSHIGIAMGGRGTDVAREASALVLLDDDFSSIVAAVRLGRRIFDNLSKAMGYILSIHIPIAGMSLLPVIFGNLPIVFWPIHIVFLELIIDPTCSVIFEAETEEKNIMDKPPRNIKEPLFNKKKVLISVLQGLSILFIICAVYFTALYLGKTPGEVRALTFTTLVISNLGLILINRSWTRSIVSMMKEKNEALKIVLGGVAVMLCLVFFVPAIRNLFHFSALHFNDLVICFICGVVSVSWFELFKYATGKNMNKQRVKK
jgi:Ca2+-transporting ATPase